MPRETPGKDTREQAIEGRTLCDCELCYEAPCHRARAIAAALTRARREGMEEAAGIADKLSTGNIVPSRGRANGGIMAKAIAQEIRRAAKEVDRG